VLPMIITAGVVATAAKAFRYDADLQELQGNVPATV